MNASAQGAVIFVVDALGSSYLPAHTATFTSGAPAGLIDMKSFDMADAEYQLKVPMPATEYGHAVIVTGYSNASEPVVSCYNATLFDDLKGDGYLTLGIMENGDTPEMIAELDAIVHNKNESVKSPNFEFVENGHSLPSDIEQMMQEYPHALPLQNTGKSPYAPYINYNAWGLNFTRALVQYMGDHHPGQNYLLIVNIGGLDSVGHEYGYEGYKAVLTGMDGNMESLIDACKTSNTILMVTGDHGMSFPNDTGRGAHEAANVADRKESLMTPLLIFSNKTLKGTGGTYGQECLAPTMLSLLDEPNTMSLSDGEPLPVKEKVSLYIKAENPEDVTITGFNYNTSASFSGIYGFKELEKGDYTIGYNGVKTNVRLDHDVLIDLHDVNAPNSPVIPPWAIYLAASVISLIGICIALKLAWMRK